MGLFFQTVLSWTLLISVVVVLVWVNKLVMTELLEYWDSMFPLEPLGCNVGFFLRVTEPSTARFCILIAHYQPPWHMGFCATNFLQNKLILSSWHVQQALYDITVFSMFGFVCRGFCDVVTAGELFKLCGFLWRIWVKNVRCSNWCFTLDRMMTDRSKILLVVTKPQGIIIKLCGFHSALQSIFQSMVFCSFGQRASRFSLYILCPAPNESRVRY